MLQATQPPPAGPSDSAPAAVSRHNTRTVVLAVSLLVALVVGVGWQVWHGTRTGSSTVVDAGSAQPDLEITVPQGYLAALAAGESAPLVPSVLQVRVGDVIRVTNHEAEPVVVGIFTVRPGETVSHRFARAGTFTGACTIHGEGEFTLRVT